MIKSTGGQKRLTMSSVNKYVEKLESLSNVAGNAKWNRHSLAVSKKLNIYLSYDPEVPFLAIYPGEMKTCSHGDLYVNVHSCIIDHS